MNNKNGEKKRRPGRPSSNSYWNYKYIFEAANKEKTKMNCYYFNWNEKETKEQKKVLFKNIPVNLLFANELNFLIACSKWSFINSLTKKRTIQKSKEFTAILRKLHLDWQKKGGEK